MFTALPLALFACIPFQDAPAPPDKKPAPKEEKHWSGSVDAGATILTGNNNSLTSTLNAQTKYEKGKDRVILDVHYTGVRQDDATGNSTTSSRLYQADGSYNRFLDEENNLYAYVNGSGRRDVPNGLQIREVFGGGGGYTFRWNEDKTQVSVEGGPSYVLENNVAALFDSFASGRAAVRIDVKLLEKVSVLANGEFLQSFETAQDRSVTGQVAVRWSFGEHWYVQGTLGVAWDNTPAAGFQTTDYRYVFSVGTSF